ncbi:MAG: tyrosine-protein phosphatase [Sphingobium sp.]
MRHLLLIGLGPLLACCVQPNADAQAIAEAAPVARAAPAIRERIVPLEQASNFRDIGGYAAAGGKHVRWARIYRAGAQPMLTDSDVAAVRALGIGNIVDLRSDEERILAPTRLDGIRYNAVGYSFAPLLETIQTALKKDGTEAAIKDMYTVLPTMIAPQVRLLFDRLLADEGATLFNCSAGQDRTGLAAALVLSALGVDRETIYADYLLSERHRHTEWEVAPIPDGLATVNPVYAYFAKYRKEPETAKPPSLSSSDGKPYLAVSFAVIEKRWGSVSAYLEQEIGLNALDLVRLRALYLE